MEFLQSLMDFILHIDQHLRTLVDNYGAWTYLVLFIIIFCETGLVITPFLPGDSLLFAAGALAAISSLDVVVLLILLSVAAILGDSVNYWIGAKVGPRAFSGSIPLLRKDYLDRTHAFYEKHGGKTIVLARFVPIVRTFAPFVAGIGAMSYPRFITYNVVGGILWVFLFTLAGYLFGNMPVVQHNFELVVIAIVLISVIPIFWEMVQSRRHGAAARPVAVEERIDA